MVTYQYRAITPDGVKTRGVVKAIDEYAAVEKIKATCPIVTKLTPVKEKDGLLSKEVGRKKINTKSLSVMCSQFSIILGSGVPISRCMKMIADQTEDKRLKKMLLQSAEDVAEGNGIAKSFEKNCKELPVTFIETIRAGEESGTLERSFETLERYYEKTYKNAQKVTQAMMYPIFVLCVAIVVLAVVMIKVIPMITETFSDLGGDLPFMTKILRSSSRFMGEHAFLIIAVIVAAIIALKLIFNTERGRIAWNRFKLKMPILGKIAVLNGASQFANTMNALLVAGITVHESLGITAKVMSNYVMGLETEQMSGSLEEGKSLGDCMRRCEYFPKTLVEMCAIGESTGELDQTMETVGAYFDNEAEYATNKAIAKLEPTILVLMALFAGFIVISIYMPMFTMYGLM